MAVVPKFYLPFLKSLSNKEVDIDSDQYKIALYTNSLVVSQTAHQYWDAAPYTSNECVGTNYTAGGLIISPGALTLDTTLKRLYYDFSDAVWSNITLNAPGARYAVLRDSTPAANKPLVMYWDFLADQLPSAGVLSVTLDALGAGYISVS